MHRSATLSAKTGHARSPRITPTWLLCTTALASGVLLASGQAFANPSGGQVVGGNASISQAPGVTTIDQKSNKAIINWQGFSIAPGETTKYKQPGRDAIALNRVRGKERSDLLGRLEANGNVWLINPNGVLVGPQAKIDVGGFLATTADIPDADFLAGRFDFSIPSPNPEAAVINQGTIFLKDKGMAALVAPHARNEGVIEGNLAQVVVAGAPTFALDFYGDGLINFEATSQVTGVTDPDQPLVENAGTIRAEGGRVLLTAEAAAGVVENVIDMSGVVEAKSFAMKGGEIVLDGRDNGIVAVAGKLDSSGLVAGERGGEVKVLGEKVGLFDGARVDVSGDAGGGTALIGGNFQGKGPENNAKRTYVAKNVKVSADAKTNGDGGKVIVWADESTEVHGTVTAKGGRESGNGGLIETSGKNLSVTAVPDASSPNGLPGTWLLDPIDITIVAGNPYPYYDNIIPSQLISAALNRGMNVIIDTSCTAPCPSDIGNITQNRGANIFKAAGGDAALTLRASNNIVLNDYITAASGRLTIDIRGDSDATGQGAVLLGATNQIMSNGGNITIYGANSSTYNSGDAVYSLAPILSLGGDISITGVTTFAMEGYHGNGIDFDDSILSHGGKISLTASNVINEGIAVGNVHSNGGDINFTVTSSTSNAISIAGTVWAGSGRVDLTADQILFGGGPYSVQGFGNLLLQPFTISRPITIGGNGNSGALNITGADLSALVSFNSITIGRSDGVGAITASSAGANFRSPVLIRTAGPLVLNGPITSIASGDAISLRTGQFTNNVGAAGLQPGSGRFLVYSLDPAQDNDPRRTIAAVSPARSSTTARSRPSHPARPFSPRATFSSIRRHRCLR